MEWLPRPEPDPVQAMLDRARADLAVQAAADYLEHSGLRILDRRWQCQDGTIDLVAAERRVLAACQVMTRTAARDGRPWPAISRARSRRMRRLAVRWITARRMLFDEVRVDLIGLTPELPGEFTIEHVRGVA